MTSSSTAHRHQRIELRTTSEIKDLLARAAALRGISVSAFLLDTAQERARQLLAEQESITLSSADWEVFLTLLDQADKPRPRLQAALHKHLARTAGEG